MIVYIAGYGRSGSTLLDIVLSNAENGTTVGEINNIFNELIETTDSYYAQILEETISQCKLTPEDVEKIKKSDKLPFKPDRNYTEFWQTFFGKIIGNDENKFIVDSSKTTWATIFRPFNLTKAGFDVKIIFLKASYSKVWESTLKGSNKSIDQKQTENGKHYLFAIKSVISKFLIDTLTFIIYPSHNYPMVNLKYETFISNPMNAIQLISTKLNVKFLGLDEKVRQNEFWVKEGYLGNRLRKSNSIIRINQNK